MRDPQAELKQRRDVLEQSEWDKEREWVPLWLAGPVLAVLWVVGCTGLLWLVLSLWERIR